MFIACLRYKMFKLRLSEDDMVPVLDTSDCTTELVRYSEIKDSGVVVENIDYKNDRLVAVEILFDITVMDEDDYVSYKNSTFVIGDIHIPYSNGYCNVKICDFTIDAFPNRVYLLYLFKFRDYVVFRFMYTESDTHMDKFCSVAVGKDGSVESWESDMSQASDIKLATMIDTLCEV